MSACVQGCRRRWCWSVLWSPSSSSLSSSLGSHLSRGSIAWLPYAHGLSLLVPKPGVASSCLPCQPPREGGQLNGAVCIWVLHALDQAARCFQLCRSGPCGHWQSLRSGDTGAFKTSPSCFLAELAWRVTARTGQASCLVGGQGTCRFLTRVSDSLHHLPGQAGQSPGLCWVLRGQAWALPSTVRSLARWAGGILPSSLCLP